MRLRSCWEVHRKFIRHLNWDLRWILSKLCVCFVNIYWTSSACAKWIVNQETWMPYALSRVGGDKSHLQFNYCLTHVSFSSNRPLESEHSTPVGFWGGKAASESAVSATKAHKTHQTNCLCEREVKQTHMLLTMFLNWSYWYLFWTFMEKPHMHDDEMKRWWISFWSSLLSLVSSHRILRWLFINKS